MEGSTAAAHGATQAAKLFGSATGNALIPVRVLSLVRLPRRLDQGDMRDGGMETGEKSSKTALLGVTLPGICMFSSIKLSSVYQTLWPTADLGVCPPTQNTAL